jgi:hypothetical protein
MKTITLDVNDELADTLARLSEAEKSVTLETLLRMLKDKRTIFDVMDDISAYARQQGLTEEGLKDLLKDES